MSRWDIMSHRQDTGIPLQKGCDLENRVRCPSTSMGMDGARSLWLPTDVLYSNYLVSGIFSVEQYRDLEIPVKGQSR